MIHGTMTKKASLGKDPLIVEEGPMTRLRAKRVKVATRLLDQDRANESLIMENKEISFMLVSKGKTDLIQTMDEETEQYNHATV